MKETGNCPQCQKGEMTPLLWVDEGMIGWACTVCWNYYEEPFYVAGRSSSV